MVIRAERNGNYTTMCNYHLRDNNLSLKAKGLLSEILSLPNEWEYSIEGLVKINKESELAIKNALKELKDNRYLWIEKIYPDKTESHKIEYIYHIYEKPYTDIQEVENQEVENQPLENQAFENQGVENQGQINTNILNTNQLKKEKSNKDNKYNALDSIPDEKLRMALEDFIKHRKDIKRPLTQKALELNIKKLDKLATDNDEKIDIINQSIENGWVGLFPLKKDKKEQIDDRYKSIMDWRLDE